MNDFPCCEPVTGHNDRDELAEAIAEVIGDTYTCTRVWEAWQYGTMTEDDFAPAWEDDELIGGIVDAVLARRTPETEWLCDECNNPWYAGGGNPNMGKYDRCTICGNDLWREA